MFLKHKELCFPNSSEVNDSFVPTLPITNTITIELHESRKATKLPLTRYYHIARNKFWELKSDFTSLVFDKTEITDTTQVAETAFDKTKRNEYV